LHKVSNAACMNFKSGVVNRRQRFLCVAHQVEKDLEKTLLVSPHLRQIRLDMPTQLSTSLAQRRCEDDSQLTQKRIELELVGRLLTNESSSGAMRSSAVTN
jgi:hypothetical protein